MFIILFKNCVCGPGSVNAIRHNIYANLFFRFNYICYKSFAILAEEMHVTSAKNKPDDFVFDLLATSAGYL